MKILYTHRTQGHGAEGAHILGMFEAFGLLGHSMEMICLPGCNPSENTPPDEQLTPGLQPAMANPSKNNLKMLLRAIAEKSPQWVFEGFELAYNAILIFRMLVACIKKKPDIVYERYALNTFGAVWVCKLFGIKHVLEVNDSVVIERSRALCLDRLATFAEKYCLTRTHLIVTITDDFKKKLLGRFRVRPDKILVLTNAISERRFQGPFDSNKVREELHLGNSTVIGSTGQFLPWHGLEEWVASLAEEAKALDLRFLFIGDGPVRQAITNRAQSLGIGDRVHFTGMRHVSEVPRLLSVLNMAIIPRAAPHASPMKLMEFMAMGLPVVAPDLPSVKAAIRHGENGLLFTDGDMAGMRSKVLDLIHAPQLAIALGQKARQLVLAELTWSGHAEKILEKLGHSSR